MIRPMLIEARKRILRTYRRWRRPRVIRHVGVRLALDRQIPPEIREFLYSGEYERGEIKALRRLLRPDDVVMELGTGIGFVSLVCARSRRRGPGLLVRGQPGDRAADPPQLRAESPPSDAVDLHSRREGRRDRFLRQ